MLRVRSIGKRQSFKFAASTASEIGSWKEDGICESLWERSAVRVASPVARRYRRWIYAAVIGKTSGSVARRQDRKRRLIRGDDKTAGRTITNYITRLPVGGSSCCAGTFRKPEPRMWHRINWSADLLRDELWTSREQRFEVLSAARCHCIKCN